MQHVFPTYKAYGLGAALKLIPEGCAWIRGLKEMYERCHQQDVELVLGYRPKETKTLDWESEVVQPNAPFTLLPLKAMEVLTGTKIFHLDLRRSVRSPRISSRAGLGSRT